MPDTTTESLTDALRAAAPGVTGACVLPPAYPEPPGWFVADTPYGRVRVDGTLTPAEQAAATVAAQAFDPSPPAEAGRVVARARALALALIDRLDDRLGVALRAVALTVLDEVNALRARDRDRAADVAAATSLADLKSRWAARAQLDDRTKAQAKAQVQGHLPDGWS